MSDGTGPVDMEPLATHVDQQSIPDVVPHLQLTYYSIEALYIRRVRPSQGGNNTPKPVISDSGYRQYLKYTYTSYSAAEARPLTEAEKKQIQAVA